MALVVNTLARSGEDEFERAREALARCDVVLAAAHRVTDATELRRRIRAELRRGASVVVVGGGDGTVSTAAGVLAGTEAALGVLPLGTANDFARTLRIPADLGRACRVIARGEVRVVDVAFAGDRAFLNAASVGVSSEVVRKVKHGGLKKRVGALAYPLAGAGAAAAARPFHARVVADGAARHDGLALQIVVGNGRFHGGGRLVAPGARLDDATLDAYVLTAPSAEAPRARGAGARLRDVLTLARYAALLARGRHVEHPRVVHLRARRLALHTAPRLDIDADGELAGRTPAAFHVAAGALRVLAPAPRSRRARRG